MESSLRESPRTRLTLAVVLVMWGLSLYYSVRDGPDWGIKTTEDRGFDAFVSEVATAIPPGARIRVVLSDPAAPDITSGRLNAALHPRMLVSQGPAEWVIELPGGEFDRSRTSYRRLSP
jgi:hypothetical protein